MFGFNTYKGNLLILLVLISVIPTVIEYIWLRQSISSQEQHNLKTDVKRYSEWLQNKYEHLVLEQKNLIRQASNPQSPSDKYNEIDESSQVTKNLEKHRTSFGHNAYLVKTTSSQRPPPFKTPSIFSTEALISSLELKFLASISNIDIELFDRSFQSVYMTRNTEQKLFLLSSIESDNANGLNSLNNQPSNWRIPLLNPLTSKPDYFIQFSSPQTNSSRFEHAITKVSIVIMLTTTSLVLLIGYVLISWMSKPMTNLSQFLDDPNIPIKQIRGAVEVERLRDRIVDNTLELQSYNANLEQLVETRTRELEASVKKNSQEHTLACMGRMAISISHEINTPLSINITTSSNIRDAIDELLDKLDNSTIKRSDLYDFLNNAKTNLATQESASLKMVDCLEKLKRVSSDTKTLSPRPIGDVINDTISVQQEALNNRNVRLHLLNEAPDSNACSQAIYQILVNLIQNSLEHAFPDRDGGNIFLVINQIESKTTMQYSDDGIGVSNAQLRHLFEPFFTSSKLGTRLGLGTYELYNIVQQQLAGSVEAKNGPSGGLQMNISFESA